MANIGEQEKEPIIIPRETPVERPEPVAVPEPTKEPRKEPVPA